MDFAPGTKPIGIGRSEDWNRWLPATRRQMARSTIITEKQIDAAEDVDEFPDRQRPKYGICERHESGTVPIRVGHENQMKVERLPKVLDHLLEVRLRPAAHRDARARVKTEHRFPNVRKNLVSEARAVRCMLEAWLCCIHFRQFQCASKVSPVLHLMLLGAGTPQRIC